MLPIFIIFCTSGLVPMTVKMNMQPTVVLLMFLLVNEVKNKLGRVEVPKPSKQFMI